MYTIVVHVYHLHLVCRSRRLKVSPCGPISIRLLGRSTGHHQNHHQMCDMTYLSATGSVLFNFSTSPDGLAGLSWVELVKRAILNNLT